MGLVSSKIDLIQTNYPQHYLADAGYQRVDE